jgi:hypothetical protein
LHAWQSVALPPPQVVLQQIWSMQCVPPAQSPSLAQLPPQAAQ